MDIWTQCWSSKCKSGTKERAWLVLVLGMLLILDGVEWLMAGMAGHSDNLNPTTPTQQRHGVPPIIEKHRTALFSIRAKYEGEKGGKLCDPPLNTHTGQSGLQETFWYHQVVSDEETPTLDQIPDVERQLRRDGTLSSSRLGTDAWTVHCRDTSTSPARMRSLLSEFK